MRSRISTCREHLFVSQTLASKRVNGKSEYRFSLYQCDRLT